MQRSRRKWTEWDLKGARESRPDRRGMHRCRWSCTRLYSSRAGKGEVEGTCCEVLGLVDENDLPGKKLAAIGTLLWLDSRGSHLGVFAEVCPLLKGDKHVITTIYERAALGKCN